MCLRSLKVLIVDDDPDVRDVVNTALSAKGFATSAVESGAAALEEMDRAIQSAQTYDVVLMDLAMPGMDGLTCALRIRDREEAAHVNPVKIGFYTGHDDLQLSPSEARRVDPAKRWRKFEMVEMVQDLQAWISDPCPANTDCFVAGKA